MIFKHLTVNEICDRITQRMNPEEVCDCLQITTEELVNFFREKIEDNQEYLQKELQDEF